MREQPHGRDAHGRVPPSGVAVQTDVMEGTGTPFEAAVVSVVSQLPPGTVATYGEVAAEAGYPGAARAVGNVLRKHDGLPWWRVVTATGRLAPGHEAEQGRRLTAEGVACNANGVVEGGARTPSMGAC
jgi:methylated-DNA-protein-cysteine methyltransferase related protein